VGTEKPTEDQPLEVAAVEGDVVITGPDGIHGALTPDAARRSARRLENAASSAAYSRDSDAADKEAGT
jgi:hypothetical protein